MARVISRDGTRIAYDRTGGGPGVVLIDGALSYRAYRGGRPPAEVLAGRFSVSTYDRRGRGESGDTKSYAVEREIEVPDGGESPGFEHLAADDPARALSGGKRKTIEGYDALVPAEFFRA